METAIISAAAAILIFTLTQIFIHLRDRQTFLQGKLEELFSSLNELSSKLTDTYYGAQLFEETGEIDELNKNLISIDKALYTPRTLFLLYFPYLTSTWEEIMVSPLRKYVDYINRSTQSNKKISSEECKKQIDPLCLKIRYLQNFLADNTAITTKSLGFHLKRIFTGKVKVKIKV